MKQIPSSGGKIKLNFSVDAEVAERAKRAADADNRNLSNFIETVLIQYCDEHGID